MWRRTPALASIAAALVGCPRQDSVSPPPTVHVARAGDANTSEPSATDVRSADEYWRLATPILCRRAVRCGTIGASELADCLRGKGRSRLTRVWGYEDLLGIEQAARQGRYRFDPSGARRCLDALRAADCHVDYLSLPARCLNPSIPVYYQPAVAPGGHCSRWDQCLDGWCSGNVGCEGTCQARAQIGEACGKNQLCTEHAFCKEARCVARGQPGDACSGHWQACEEGLFCDGYRPPIDSVHYLAPEQPGRCAKPRGEGEACATQSSSELCAAALFCDWGADPPICRTRLARGAQCRWLDACADGLACIGLVLAGSNPHGRRLGVAASGRCLPLLDREKPCNPAATVSGCPTSMICDRARKRCRSSGHEGDACESSWCPPDLSSDKPCRREGCVSSLYCDQTTHTCRRQRRIGDSCVPAKLGVDDEPCFSGECDPATRRCVDTCRRK